MDWLNLRLKLRFSLVGAPFLPPSGVLSTPNCDFLQLPLQVLHRLRPAKRVESDSELAVLTLPDRLEEQCRGGGRDVERLDCAKAR